MIIIVRSLASVLQNKKIAFLSLLVLFGLVGVSIWDSAMIFDTYMNDNRMTVVKTVDVEKNDSLRYLENIFIKFQYDMSIVFPERVAKGFFTLFPEYSLGNLFNGDSVMYKSLAREVSNGSFTLDNANVSNVDDRRKAYMIFALLDSLDYDGVFCAGGKRSAGCIDDGKVGSFAWLTNIMRNGSSLENLESRLWLFFRKTLVASEYGTQNLSDYFSVSLPSMVDLTAEIETSQILKGHNAQFSMIFGPRYLPDAPLNSSSDMTVWISTRTEDLDGLDLSSANPCDIRVQIENVGMFDRLATTSCTNEPYTVFDADARYDHRAQLENAVEKCGCVPFRYKRQYHKLALSKTGETPPFCDVEAYARCHNLTLDEISLPQCVKAKNQYQVLRECNQAPGNYCVRGENNNLICGHSRLTMKTSGDFYAVYKERYQMTSSQFVGQLGGDIGLYTGLSVLSIWQLILFFYNKYSKFKASFEQQSNGTELTRVQFYKAFTIGLLKHIEESVTSGGRVEHHHQEGQMTRIENGAEETVDNPAEFQKIVSNKWVKTNERLDGFEGRIVGLDQKFDGITQTLQHLQSDSVKMREMLEILLECESRRAERAERCDAATETEERADEVPSRAKFVPSIQQKKVRRHRNTKVVATMVPRV